MEAYVLILLGKGLKTESESGDYYHDLQQGFCLVVDQLLRSERSNGYKTFKEENINEDPIVSLLQRKRKLNFALSCSCYIEKLFPDISNTSKWLSVREKKEQLTGVLEQLEMTLNKSGKVGNTEENSSNIAEDEEEREDNEDDDSVANQIHNLTDTLPNKGDAVVQIYWILSDHEHLNISNTLSIFGALKRLQECNNAHINIVSNEADLQSCSFLDTWKKLLQFSICLLDSPRLLDIPIWNGSLTYMGNEEGKLVHLPGFALTSDDGNHRMLYLEDDEERMSSHSMFLSGIQLLHSVPRNNIPLFLFLPYKLKLHLLYDREHESKVFIEKLKSSFSKGMCLLASLTLKQKSEKSNPTSLETWMESILSSTDDPKSKDCNQKSTKSANQELQRLCVIDSNSEGSICVYLIRKTEDIRGDLYEYLENLTRGKQILENEEKDHHLNLQDMSVRLLEEQQENSLLHCKEVAAEIVRSKDGENVPLTSQVLCEIVKSAAMNPQKSCHLLPKYIHLDLSNSLVYQKGISPAFDSSQSLCAWQERLWLIQKDPSRIQANKKPPFVGTLEALSLSAKDILKCFRADGKPVKNNLSPLKPPTNKSMKDSYININTNEATIQETLYPESLIKKFHGIEYCLDSYSSLSKDERLSQTQTSVVRQETLSLSSELTPRAFPKKAKQAVNKKKSLEVGGKEKQLRQNRPTKRKSPSTQTTKHVKRKRNASPTKKEDTKRLSLEEVASDDTAAKAKETRSQRHKRRLRLVVEKTLEENGINKDHTLYPSCSERLYTLIKSFLKDLKSSHGLNETMKELALSNVEQVVNFEKTRLRLQEKKRTRSRDKSSAT